MKKVLYGAAAALAILAASCSKTDNGVDSRYFSETATDSLLNSFGDAVGATLNAQINNAMMGDSTITKAQFLKGLQYAMACDTADTYMNGVIVGLQIQRQLNTFHQMGVDVDRTVVLNAFKKAFLADTVADQMALSQLDGVYRQWSDSLQRAKRAHDVAVLEAKPEAKENIAKGEAYIKDLMAKDDSVKVTANGVAYKIVNAGEGEKVDPTRRAVLSYTAKTLDGQLVEKYNQQPVNMATRTQGLREGVAMLGKGGKATFYVPGNLAYGVEVPARLGIGLNELVIYEVEVVEYPAPGMGGVR